MTTIRRAGKGRQGDTAEFRRNNATVSYGNTFLLMRRFVHRMECHLSLPRESLLISPREISSRYRGSLSHGAPMSSQCTRIHWRTGFLPPPLCMQKAFFVHILVLTKVVLSNIMKAIELLYKFCSPVVVLGQVIELPNILRNIGQCHCSLRSSCCAVLCCWLITSITDR